MMEITKMVCTESLKGWVTPGKTYDFHQTTSSSYTILTSGNQHFFNYTYFIGDDEKVYDVNLIKDLNKYFVTLEEWRQIKLNEIGI